jgi:hypothetical protein
VKTTTEAAPEKPKLLHELDWQETSPGWARRADVRGHRIYKRGDNKHNILSYSLSASKPRWMGLDPITAQAVLTHMQSDPDATTSTTNPQRSDDYDKREAEAAA